MTQLAPLIRDLAVILGVAAAVTFIFRRIRQPVILGYILAGVIVGPFTPPFLSVTDLPNVHVWAELGVIFLMFTLGLEFSFRKLAKVGVTASFIAIMEIAMMIALGYWVGDLLGLRQTNRIFLGCMVGISSTTIIVKTLDELGLKGRGFAQTIFGILIFEDLVAITMLVGLSSFVIKSSLGGLELLITIGKLGFVMGIWVLVGMFFVPRFVKSVGRHGNDEMLTVVSLGLCLTLVAIAAALNYSVALGAFIMGSILAESPESHRIEQLVKPLRDIFGAVFFVTVGMMIDPSILATKLGMVAVIAVTVIVGKMVAVTVSCVLTGHRIPVALQTGSAMAQIGEFSFIIAALGQRYQVISSSLYPVIVAVSLVTTFTTPYLMRLAMKVAPRAEQIMPAAFRRGLDGYVAWVQRVQTDMGPSRALRRAMLRWVTSSIVVIAVFLATAEMFLPWLTLQFSAAVLASFAGWSIAIAVSAPFIWAMLVAFRPYSTNAMKGPFKDYPRLVAILTSRLLTILLVGSLSLEFFVWWLSLALTVGVSILFFMIFSRHLDGFYQWYEGQFRSHIKRDELPNAKTTLPYHLAPWDTRLARLEVDADAEVVGRSMVDAQIRERFGINVVAIQRGSKTIVAPQATVQIFPGDHLLVLGSDEAIDVMRAAIERNASARVNVDEDFATYHLGQLLLAASSPIVGLTIRDSRIKEDFASLVVGVERGHDRHLNPKSDFVLEASDRVWIVGHLNQIQVLAALNSQHPIGALGKFTAQPLRP